MASKRTVGSILGTIFALIGFAATIFVFSRGLGWPDSLASMGVVLFAAFFVGAGFGNLISRTRPTVLAPIILAAALAVGSVAWGIPWEGVRLSIGGSTEENVPFLTEGYFYLLGTEDNGLVENVWIYFPTPQIENQGIQPMSRWKLYYMDENGTLQLEQDSSPATYNFYGQRTEPLQLLSKNYVFTSHGPKINHNVDKLYPREVFRVDIYVTVPPENADKVTLVEFGENGRTTGVYDVDKNISLSFSVVLKRGTWVTENVFGELHEGIRYEIIENFSRTLENVLPEAWVWLYPNT